MFLPVIRDFSNTAMSAFFFIYRNRRISRRWSVYIKPPRCTAKHKLEHELEMSMRRRMKVAGMKQQEG
jgi:hypothetical protein